MTKRYKYECRPCPPHIRARCIQEAHISPAAKTIIARAFESQTDTQDTWDLLQRTCLRLRMDNIPVVGLSKNRALLSRLERIHEKEAPELQEPVEEPPTVSPRTERPAQRESKPRTVPEKEKAAEPPRPPVVRPRMRRPPQPTLRPRIVPEEHVQEAGEPPPSTTRDSPRYVPPKRSPIQNIGILSRRQTRRVEQRIMQQQGIHYPHSTRPHPSDFETPGPRVLVSQKTGHRILLPEDGELVLGRFDPMTEIKADVDLTYEDQITPGISRRHAQVIGWRGQYEIEDLGSSNGTWLNGQRVALQSRHKLQVGDEIRLGNCIFYLDHVPSLWKTPASTGQYFFYITFTGHYIPLPDQDTIIIGRTDETLGFVPDINLSQEEEAISVVSRRHAKLTRRGEQFMIEDLGSTCKTQVNGVQIYVGVKVPLYTGQHLWLGGYTLAFDRAEKAAENG